MALVIVLFKRSYIISYQCSTVTMHHFQHLQPVYQLQIMWQPIILTTIQIWKQKRRLIISLLFAF